VLTTRALRALEIAIQRPDVAGAQPLETDPDGGLIAGALLDHPAHVTRDLDRFGLCRKQEAKLHGRADRKRRRGFQIETAQRDVARLRGLLLALEQDLD